MRIATSPLVSGASNAEGIVVIIDVLRACTTVSILLDQEVEEIIPVRNADEAILYRTQNYILIGEGEHGTNHEVFDYNNSPSEIMGINFTGKKVVLRSNNATQAILNAEKADEVILGSFLNYRAVAEYIKRQNPETLTLVPLGRLGKPGLEDDLCAKLIQDEITGNKYNLEEISRQVETCDCAILVKDQLNRPGDVEIALEFNKSSVVPKLFLINHTPYIKKAK